MFVFYFYFINIYIVNIFELFVIFSLNYVFLPKFNYKYAFIEITPIKIIVKMLTLLNIVLT